MRDVRFQSNTFIRNFFKYRNFNSFSTLGLYERYYDTHFAFFTRVLKAHEC
jgi:hypothetical protein